MQLAASAHVGTLSLFGANTSLVTFPVASPLPGRRKLTHSCRRGGHPLRRNNCALRQII